jgi:hypothetical protein
MSHSTTHIGAKGSRGGRLERRKDTKRQRSYTERGGVKIPQQHTAATPR